MKIKLLIITLVFYVSLSAQNKIDSLLGTKGVCSKLKPKDIIPNSTINFNLKLTILSTAVGGSNKQNTSIVYLNTKDGFIGMDKTATISLIGNANTEVDFLVETLTKQSLWYTNTKSDGKQLKKLPTNLITSYNNLPIKKVDAAVATSKKYLTNKLIAEPYFLDMVGLQKKVIRYLYGTPLPANGVFKNYLGNYGVGFYNINDATFLCLATESKVMKTEITKIEKVNIEFNTTGFKEKK